jgi:hypothetical protein
MAPTDEFVPRQPYIVITIGRSGNRMENSRHRHRQAAEQLAANLTRAGTAAHVEVDQRFVDAYRDLLD